MTLLLLGLALGLGVLAAWGLRGARPAGALLLLLLYVAPVAWLGHALGSTGERGTRLRFALLGLGFRAEPESDLTITVGGHQERHDVWFAALERKGDARLSEVGGLVWPRALGTGVNLVRPAVELRAAPPPGRGAPPAAFFGVAERAPAGFPLGLLGLPGPRLIEPLGAVALASGDSFDVGGVRYHLAQSRPWFTSQAAFVRADGQRLELPRRLGAPWSGIQASYPLAALDDAMAALTAPVPAAAPDPDTPGADTRAFVFHQPARDRHTLWLYAPPGDPLALERAGKTVEAQRTRVLAEGARVVVLSPPRPGRGGLRREGYRDRRSFRVLTAAGGLVLAFDSPEVRVVTWPTVSELAAAAAAGHTRTSDGTPAATTLRVPLSFGDWQITEESLHLTNASRRIAVDALATLELPAEASRGAARSFSASTPAGQRSARFGEPLWLGAERLAAVQVDVLTPPWGLVWLGLLLAALKSVAARAARVTVAQSMLFGAFEALVTLRLALAWRVFVLPPFSEEAVRLALVAWVVVPWALLLAALPRAAGAHTPPARRAAAPARDWAAWSPALPALAGACFSLAWCLCFDGESAPRALFWLLVHGLLLGVALQRLFGLPERVAQTTWARLGQAARAWRRPAAVDLEGTPALPTQAASRWHAWLPAAELRPSVCAALLLLGLRVVLAWLLGWRESLSVGGERFALSLLHVPAAVLVQSALLLALARRWRAGAAFRRGPRDAAHMRVWGDLLAVAIVALALWVLPALAVSDFGLALLNLPVLLLGLLGVGWSLAGAPDRGGFAGRVVWLRRVASVLLAGYLLLVCAPPALRWVVSGVRWMTSAEQELDLASNRNWLRVLEFAAPAELRAVGRRQSEELAVMTAVLHAYTHGPLLGRGYFASEVSPHIQATALREHVPAVFVAAEWGLAGTLGLLLLYLALAGGGAAWWPDENEIDATEPRTARAGHVALLGTLTLALPSVYMLLANYRLVLFTGKNAYLLGLDSTADVLEVLLLAVLVAMASARVRDAREAA